MYKKILCIFILSVVAVFSLSACGSAEQKTETIEEVVVSEVSDENTETADIEIEESVSIENTETAEEVTEKIQEAEKVNLFEQDVLYRADFEIPDCRGLGYTNMVDFYNEYPNGKPGGTFGNAGLLVHYREDIDMDMSREDSLVFRTYRGIGLGSTLEEVFDVYGTEQIRPPFEEAMGLSNEEHVLTSFVDYNGRIESGALAGIRFYFDQNNTVMYIDYGAVYAQYASGANVKDVVTE